MRRIWVKLYVDQCLRGSMIAELSPTQRWMFVGLILLAGDSPIPGQVYRRKDENGLPVGYSDAVLADTLGVDESEIRPGIARMVEKSKVFVDALGVISISNWTKYQSEYERTRSAPSRVVQKYGVEGDIDIERDRDKNITYDASSRRWFNITAADMEAWVKAYPTCDINTELAKAGEWIIANPAKGKKSNYRRFIVNWLSRSQDRGGGMPSRRPGVESPHVGASTKSDDHSPAYWQEVRRLRAEGKEGQALTDALAKAGLK